MESGGDPSFCVARLYLLSLFLVSLAKGLSILLMFLMKQFWALLIFFIILLLFFVGFCSNLSYFFDLPLVYLPSFSSILRYENIHLRSFFFAHLHILLL
jgi:hypothetical protein